MSTKRTMLAISLSLVALSAGAQTSSEPAMTTTPEMNPPYRWYQAKPEFLQQEKQLERLQRMGFDVFSPL